MYENDWIEWEMPEPEEPDWIHEEIQMTLTTLAERLNATTRRTVHTRRRAKEDLSHYRLLGLDADLGKRQFDSHHQKT